MMKIFILISSLLFVVQSGATTQKSTFIESARPRLLGSKECTWGPSYWCKNLTAAASCHATKHCIQTVWMHKQLPPDSSDICQTCLKMVKEARDNLLSNDTQDLIKQVFEGTCNLTYFKPIVEECDRIVDSFIPDLIDTLASEMNPQVVCSVAGLCNNEKYLQSLEGQMEVPSKSHILKKDPDTCTGCKTVVNILENKFETMSKDDVLQMFLMVCRDTGSFSDACSNIVLTYFTDMYTHLKEFLNADEICLLSGECSAIFHRHDEPATRGVQITPISNIGYVPVNNAQDDLACEFCEQLVKHLRDLLVANNTEEQFKLVLKGLCKQTQSFTDECTALVDEYYSVAYDFLVNEMNSTAVCAMAGICPKKINRQNIPLVPLLPAETADALQIKPVPKKPILARVPLTKNAPSIQIISKPQLPLGDLGKPENAQLPIERMVPPFNQVMYNKEVCEFCQFFLHYVQQAITDPKTEEQIQATIEKACNELPSSVNATCINFVQTYEPALVALLAQEIDPSQICPLIRACPSGEMHDVDIFMQQDVKDNSKCPLCLFAVQKLEEMVKDNKTESDIKDALGKLCSKLSKDLAKECQDFVDTYTDELVEMLIKDFNPKEVCVYLKLCTDSKPAEPVIEPVSKTQIFVNELETNEIFDNTYNGVVMGEESINNQKQLKSIPCGLCKLIVKEINDFLGDNRTEDAIISAVNTVCNLLPAPTDGDCVQFMDKNVHALIPILHRFSDPYLVCSLIQVCFSTKVNDMEGVGTRRSSEQVRDVECTLCKVILKEINQILGENKTEEAIISAVNTVCHLLPEPTDKDCADFMDQNIDSLIKILQIVSDPFDACSMMQLCSAPHLSGIGKTEMSLDNAYNKQIMETMKVEIFDCSICETAVWAMEKVIRNPKVDHDIEHVLEKTCRALPMKDQHKCQEMIEKYGIKIFNWVAQNMDKRLICREIGICGVGSKVLVENGEEEMTAVVF